MKTAVWLPDDVFRAAGDLARRQGMSTSALCALALAEYAARHHDEDVASKLNAVLAEEESCSVDPALRKAQARSVGSETR